MRALIALLLMTTPALAAQCGPHDDVSATLERSFGETAQVQGLTPDGSMFEVFANPEKGTWTVTMTTADGVTCLKAAGDRYQAAPQGDPA